MTKQDAISECKRLCPRCADEQPVTAHLGGAEWVHSVNNRGSHSVVICLASKFRVEHQDILKNG